MYLTIEVILRALEELKRFHPFYGITFLAFKENKIPIGTTKKVSIGSLERILMDEYYKPFEESSWYYRVFRPNDSNKRWLDSKYPGSGSQSTRTRGRIAQAFIHNTREPLLWGWRPNYVDILSERLRGGRKIPAFYLASWLYRLRQWNNGVTPNKVIDVFLSEFNITKEEIEGLFDITIPSGTEHLTFFESKPIQLEDLIPTMGTPPDLPESGGILSFLELQGVGPAEKLTFEPGRRINLITGDNGQGKTFLLDICWWALTGQWLDYPADPTNTLSKQAKISYRVAGEYRESETIKIEYDQAAFSWPIPEESKADPCLLVYARADNSFAIWDPAQHSLPLSTQSLSSQSYYKFSPDDVWFGLEDKVSRRSICEGLIRDWVNWQSTTAKEFDELTQILKRLSPKDLGELRPGKPIRVPVDKRPMPTLSMPYGDVAVIYASAGIRRIISLAYLLVWAWSEHKIASEQANQSSQRRMVILIDEIEAHLHPKWQRLILPALVDVQNELSQELDVQFLIATHSPFVTVSVEPVFDIDTDKIFNLDFIQKDLLTRSVVLKELPFIKYGVIDSWLVDVFGVDQPRHNVAGGTALEDAKQIQLQDNPDPQQVHEIHQRLVKFLAPDDEFWPRWLFFAEQHGVEI